MHKLIAIVTLFFSCFASFGCSWVGEAANPYKSSFNCPMKENGKCINMTDAYKESLEQKGPGLTAKPVMSNEGRSISAHETAYQASLYKKLIGLIDEPSTPVIAPPKIMRVLLLPYKGSDKELFMYRYVFFVVDDYTWVLGDNDQIGEH